MKYLAITSLVLLLTASAFANDEEIEKRGGLGGYIGIGGFGGRLGGRIAGGYPYQPVGLYGKPTLPITAVKPSLYTPKLIKREEIEKRGGVGGWIGGFGGRTGGGYPYQPVGLYGKPTLPITAVKPSLFTPKLIKREEIEKRGGVGGWIGGFGGRIAGGYPYQPVGLYGKPTLPITAVKPSLYTPKLIKREVQNKENRVERGWQKKLEVEPIQVQQTVVAEPSIAIKPAVQIAQPSIAVRPAVQVVRPAVQVVQPSIAVQPAIAALRPSIAVQPAVQTVQTGISSPGLSLVQSSIKKREDGEHETEKRYVKTVSGGYQTGAVSVLGGGSSILGGGLSGLVGGGLILDGDASSFFGGYGYQPTLAIAEPTYTVSQPIAVAQPSASTTKIV